MLTQTDIINRIGEMADCPGMWAWSEEAFFAQLLVYLDVLGIDEDTLTEWVVEQNVKFKIDIEDDRAKEMVQSALALAHDFLSLVP